MLWGLSVLHALILVDSSLGSLAHVIARESRLQLEFLVCLIVGRIASCEYCAQRYIL